ncbi:MAG: GIY-YIG nuclease family protein [Anaerolineae bacterium]|nr:GIY-YIG nuclease family protein [Anaerolineae bacterium]NUQ06465.1 GIY-YIG nuclease family protein [Anaerolineae bacterium]
MRFSTIQDVKEAGFQGFVAVKDLQCPSARKVFPDVPGVYVVLRMATTEPRFLPVGTSFRKVMVKPYAVERLQRKWARVRGSPVVYIGKSESLRRRLNLYLGLRRNHSGGRAIWQFSDAADLLVCWTPTSKADPRAIEKQLLGDFFAAYSSLPFANWAL